MKRLLFILLFVLRAIEVRAFFEDQPNLLVILVVDQMRSDQIIKWKPHFSRTGFIKLMKEGAYVPFAEYPVLQNMTCPGHAMISTGSTPSSNKIPLNEWYSEKEKRLVPCVFDPKFDKSPKNLSGSTIGDQIKIRYPKAQVVSVALKDRSAIMLGGHTATVAYWFDQQQNQWVTSSYYEKVLPEIKTWVHPKNPKVGEKLIFEPRFLKGKANFKFEIEWGTSQAFSHPIALEQTFDFTYEVLKKYKLGRGPNLDVLLISLSNHDVAGHIFGPDADESLEIMIQEDRKISELLSFLKGHVRGGYDKLWFILTADHGVAPLVEYVQSLGLNSGRIDLKSRIGEWNKELKSKFDYCSADWIVSTKSFHLYLNQECLAKNLEKSLLIQAQIINWIRSLEGVENVVVCDTHRVTPHFLPPSIEKRVKPSCVPGVSGQLIVIPKPFWYEQGPPATHMTHYSYDRVVPVIFWGKPFKSGVIQNEVSVLDLASTLLYGLGIFPTAQAEGKVQFEVFKSKP